MRGFVLIDRALLDHHIVGVSNKDRLAIWLTLLCAAAWKDRTVFVSGKEINLKRGQMVFSIRNLAKQSGTTKRIVERTLKHLKTGTMVGTEVVTGINVITICNYDKFQNIGSYRGDSNGDSNGDATVTGRGQDGDIKESLKTPEETPDKKRTPPSGSKKSKVIIELEKVLSPEFSQAIVEHRTKLKKTMSQRAAKLLADRLALFADPSAAADLMIMRGWQSIELEWGVNAGLKACEAGTSDGLVTLHKDSQEFKAVEKLTGKSVPAGNGGTATFQKSEIEQAMKAIAKYPQSKQEDVA